MDDYYCIEEDPSDNELYDSSSEDDDFKQLFEGIVSGIEKEDNGDDFEREMEKERNEHRDGEHEKINTSESKSEEKPDESKKGEDDGDIDELYDPDADDKDQRWIDNLRRQQGQGLGGKSDCKDKKGGKNRSIKSDATLNCPCCMTLLCLDCQRHDIYKTQYRAMFVLNCIVDFTQKMIIRDKDKSKWKRSKQRDIDIASSSTSTSTSTSSSTSTSNEVMSEIYFPVKCNICDTQVAVHDHDQVYHFFNVLASFA